MVTSFEQKKRKKKNEVFVEKMKKKYIFIELGNNTSRFVTKSN